MINPFASLRAGFTLEPVRIEHASAPIGAGDNGVRVIELVRNASAEA